MDLNYKESGKKWEENFYENGWEPDTLKYTETESKIMDELKTFLPRHMPVYDWNLPYAEVILLIFRRYLKGQTVLPVNLNVNFSWRINLWLKRQ